MCLEVSGTQGGGRWADLLSVAFTFTFAGRVVGVISIKEKVPLLETARELQIAEAEREKAITLGGTT